MARPKIHDDALRITLLNRAAALVFEHGWSSLSLRKLAGEADTSTTAVYSLFGNKAGLLDSLHREATDRFATKLTAVRRTVDPSEDVVRLGLQYRNYALANPHLYSIMFSTRDRRGEPDDELIATFEPLLAAVHRAQDAGQFRAAPAEHIALSCWGMAHGLVSVEMSVPIPPGIDVATSYEDSLRAVVVGWRPAGPARRRRSPR